MHTMARRKSKRKSPRRFTGYNLWDLGVAYGQTSIMTTAAFRMNPIEFVLGDLSGKGAGSGFGYGSSRVSLKELVSNFNAPHGSTGKTEAELVWANIQNNWQDAALQSIGLSIGTKVAKKLLSQPRRSINKLLKAGGMSSMVRV